MHSPKQIAHAQKVPLARRMLTTISQSQLFRFRFPLKFSVSAQIVGRGIYNLWFSFLFPFSLPSTAINIVITVVVTCQQYRWIMATQCNSFTGGCSLVSGKTEIAGTLVDLAELQLPCNKEQLHKQLPGLSLRVDNITSTYALIVLRSFRLRI